MTFNKVTFYLLLLCFFSLTAFSNDKLAPIALNGILNLQDWELKEDGAVSLDGNWEFYWNQLKLPSEFIEQNGSKNTHFQLPDLWSSPSRNTESYPAKGFATFRLKVKGKFKNKPLALLVPSMYSSYKLWVDNELVAINGNVGIDAQSTKPYWKPISASFIPEQNELTITLQIANFHHGKGGLAESILIGDDAELQAIMSQRYNANLIHIVGLAILSLLTFISYFYYKKNFILWFTLFSILWSVRGLFSNMYIFHDWFTDFNWTLAAKIEYITLYASLLVGVHTFDKIYTKYTYPFVNKISLIVNSIFLAITIATPVYLFSQLLLVFFIFMGLLLIYILTCIINAVIHDARGSITMAIGVILVVILFFYDLLSYQGVIGSNPYVLNIGYMLLYYMLGISLIYHVAKNQHDEINSTNSVYNYDK